MGSWLSSRLQKIGHFSDTISWRPHHGTHSNSNPIVSCTLCIDEPWLFTPCIRCRVQQNIVESLKLSTTHLFKVVHPFNRANLFYEVISASLVLHFIYWLLHNVQLRYTGAPNPSSQMADIYEYITRLYRRRGRPSSGIIYCRARVVCDELSAFLRGKGLSARPYHRGIAYVLHIRDFNRQWHTECLNFLSGWQGCNARQNAQRMGNWRQWRGGRRGVLSANLVW